MNRHSWQRAWVLGCLRAKELRDLHLRINVFLHGAGIEYLRNAGFFVTGVRCLVKLGNFCFGQTFCQINSELLQNGFAGAL